METIETKKTDAAKFAHEDLSSHYNKWDIKEWKPGEKKIIRHYQDNLSVIMKEKKQKEKQLEILKAAGKNAIDFEITDDNKKLAAEKLNIEIQQLEKELQSKNAEMDNIKEAISPFYFRYSHWKLNSTDKIMVLEKPKVWRDSIFRNVLPGIILVIFCTFDGVNMFLNLQNFRNDTIRHGILCVIIFLGVLFTSLNIKRKNSLIFWVGFLLFLSAANAAQFLGRNPKIGLSNLIDSPERIVIFIISFFGSIMVTLIYQKLHHEKEEIQNQQKIEKPAVSPEEIKDRTNFNLLQKRLTDEKTILDKINLQIGLLRDQLQDLNKNSDQEKNHRMDEKIEAIQMLTDQEVKVQSEIEKLETEAKYLPEKCRQSIEEYRQEVALQQLINGYPKLITYQDIESITL